MYRGYHQETGTIFESDRFSWVYRQCMLESKGWVYDHGGTSLFHINDSADDRLVAVVCVNNTGYLIDYGTCIMQVDKDVWSIDRL